VQNSEKLKEIAKVEQTFWRWAFKVVDNLTIDRSNFDNTKSLPCDWYPPFTQAPFNRHNLGVEEVGRGLAELRTKLGRCIEKLGAGKAAERQSGLNKRQLDLITREIDDLMESLKRMDEMKMEEQEEVAVKLIPELPFKDFSEAKLQRIITKSERKNEEISRRSCPVIAQIVHGGCELGYQPHGWTFKLAPTGPLDKEDEEDSLVAPLKKRPVKTPAPVSLPASRPREEAPSRATKPKTRRTAAFRTGSGF
jgi:hypothetical protein